MAGFRLSRLARADLTQILRTSAERWGIDGRRRYIAVLAAAMRMVADDPNARASRDRSDLFRGIRSFHLRHVRSDNAGAVVQKPVHVVYYRVIRPGLVEIVRVLHERMEPSRHLENDSKV